MSTEAATKPAREALTSIGFTELLTAEDVDRSMGDALAGTVLVAINTDDDTARDIARPGVKAALESAGKRPDRLFTVLHGVDREATARMFSRYIPEIPPSEPSFALFKNGELVHFLPGHRIASLNAGGVAAGLEGPFGEFCE
ncbi:BrxA/BrxB family bacilliredoxin [Streptomyces albidoflavus]